MSKLVLVELSFNGLPCRVFKSAKALSTARVSDCTMPIGEVCEMDRRQAAQQIRLQVWQRAGGECEDCGQSVPVQAFHMHEGIHRGQGGEISLANSHCLCYTCHFDIEHGNRKPRFGEKVEIIDADDLTSEPPFIAEKGVIE